MAIAEFLEYPQALDCIQDVMLLRISYVDGICVRAFQHIRLRSFITCIMQVHSQRHFPVFLQGETTLQIAVHQLMQGLWAVDNM